MVPLELKCTIYMYTNHTKHYREIIRNTDYNEYTACLMHVIVIDFERYIQLYKLHITMIIIIVVRKIIKNLQV